MRYMDCLGLNVFRSSMNSQFCLEFVPPMRKARNRFYVMIVLNPPFVIMAGEMRSCIMLQGFLVA